MKLQCVNYHVCFPQCWHPGPHACWQALKHELCAHPTFYHFLLLVLLVVVVKQSPLIVQTDMELNLHPRQALNF